MSQMIILGIVIVLLASSPINLNAADSNSTRLEFLENRTVYSSPQEYSKKKGKRLLNIDSQGLAFFDAQGNLLGRVSLEKDSRGYVGFPLFSQEGDLVPVVVRSTGGHEWRADILEFFDQGGRKINELKPSSLAYAVSPRGDRIISLQREGHGQNASATISLFNQSGSRLVDFRPTFQPQSVSYAFSKSGRIVAAFFYARDSYDKNKNKGGIVVLDSDGEVLGAYEAVGWFPQSDIADGIGASPFAPLARIDESARIVVAQGLDLKRKARTVLAVNFEGTLRWRWDGANNPRCHGTVLIRPSHGRVTVTDICAESVLLTDLDFQTGKLIAERKIPVALGKVGKITSSVSDGTGHVILSVIPGDSGRDGTLMLLNPQLEVLRREAIDASRYFSARFDNATGKVVIRRGDQIYEGFAPD